MILFDCERMRKPFAGKYTYCKSLAEALVRESNRRNEPLGLYFPPKAGPFLEDFYHLDWNRCHQFWLPLGKDIRLFHSASPISKYYPRFSRVPVLTTIHDLNFLHYDMDPRKKRQDASRTRAAFRRSARIVTISEDARNDILAHYDCTGKTIDVIYNGVDRYEGPVTTPERVPDGPFLLSVCRVTRSKNLQTLPALLEKNDLRLVIVGKDMKDGHVGEILQEAGRWGVRDRVILTGGVPEAEKHWYLQHCKAFLFPSLAEGFGLPVVEAMLYGKPVFCSDRTSLPEVGGPFAFYFNHDFEPRAMQEEFGSGMSAFAAGTVDKAAMLAHARSFSWENAARRYYDIYEQMI